MSEVKNYPPYLDYPKPYKAQTNADRIRGMSDEELAEFLCSFRADYTCGYPCKGCKAERYCSAGHTGTIDWLKQPSEEADHG